MSRFLKKFIYLLFVVTSIWGLLSTLIYWSDPYQCRLEQFCKESEAIEAITMGHSLNAAIDFDALGMNGYHLWRVGSDIYEAEVTLNKIIEKAPNLKVVYMAASYALPYNSDHSFAKRSRVYNEFPYAPPIEGDWENYIKSRVFRLNKANYDVFSNIGKNFNILVGAADCITYYSMPEIIDMEDELFSYSKEEIGRKCIDIDSIFTSGMVATLKRHPDAVEMAQQQLIKLVKISEAHGIKLILFSPPLSEPFTKKYLSDEHTLNQDLIMNYVINHVEVPYYDFTSDVRFNQNLSLFADPVHMNKDGARAFSLVLKEKINP